MSTSLLRTMAAGVLFAGVASCNADAYNPNQPADCKTDFTSYTSPAPGTVTFTGNFYSNESVILMDGDGTMTFATGTPATDRTSFTLTGLPSGTQRYKFRVSCAAGEADIATTLTIK
jgi:hypothetical protein